MATQPHLIKKGQATRLSRPMTPPRQTAHGAHQYVGGTSIFSNAHHSFSCLRARTPTLSFAHLHFVSLNTSSTSRHPSATFLPAHLTTPIRSRLVACIVSGHAPTGVRARGGEDGQAILQSFSQNDICVCCRMCFVAMQLHHHTLFLHWDFLSSPHLHAYHPSTLAPASHRIASTVNMLAFAPYNCRQL
jgi:hypothetical protein